MSAKPQVKKAKLDGGKDGVSNGPGKFSFWYMFVVMTKNKHIDLFGAFRKKLCFLIADLKNFGSFSMILGFLTTV